MSKFPYSTRAAAIFAALAVVMFLFGGCSPDPNASKPKLNPDFGFAFVETDPQTGCEYLISYVGRSITARLGAEGRPICKASNRRP